MSSDSICSSMALAKEADTEVRARVRKRVSRSTSSPTDSVVPSLREEPGCQLFGSGGDQDLADPRDLGVDLPVDLDQGLGRHPVAAHLGEALQQPRPQHHRLVAADLDQPDVDHALQVVLVAGQRAGLGQRHGHALVGRGGTSARSRPEELGQVAAVLPGAQHLEDVGAGVAALEHRGDDLEPRQVGVVEDRHPALTPRRLQQPALLVGADVAHGHAAARASSSIR